MIVKGTKLIQLQTGRGSAKFYEGETVPDQYLQYCTEEHKKHLKPAAKAKEPAPKKASKSKKQNKAQAG